MIDPIIQPTHLAQLIILDHRWPLFLDYLQERPGGMKEVGQQAPADAPKSIHSLFIDEDVLAVVTGKWKHKRIAKPLTEEAVAAYRWIRIPHVVPEIVSASGVAKL